MIMGAILLLGIKYLAVRAGATLHQQDLLIVVITYSLLFSLLLINLLSYVLSRFVADMVYNNLHERIMPSMYGSISLLLVFGAPAWAVFLYFSKLPFEYSFFHLPSFVWQLSYGPKSATSPTSNAIKMSSTVLPLASYPVLWSALFLLQTTLR